MTSSMAARPEPAKFAGGIHKPSLSDLVLQLIWQRKEISRADIARAMELSRSTVSRIVADLLLTRLIADVGVGPSRGGRRPVLVAFQDNARVILGVDVGASHVSAALTDLRGRVLAWRERGHPVRSDPAGTASLMAELCDSCLAARERPASDLVGIGVAVPSPVDPRDPGRMFEPIFPAWRGHSVVEPLRKRYRTPVFVDNDANLGAVAEHRWGWGVGVNDLTYLKVSTGIGAGHVIDGKLYRGASGMAGEIGHVATASDGPPLCVRQSRMPGHLRGHPRRAEPCGGAASGLPAERARRPATRHSRCRGSGSGRRSAGAPRRRRSGPPPWNRNRRCSQPHEPGNGDPRRQSRPAR